MAKVLVIRAHPLSSETSRSMQLTDQFVRVYQAAHPEDTVREVRLYDVAIPEIDLDLLTAWTRLRAGTPFVHLSESEQVKSTLFAHYTDQFLDADKIVVANPLWNLMVPTHLKAWIDTISVSGRTFRYDAAGAPVGLARGKKALHIQTSGGHFGGKDPASVYLRTVFTFLGVADYEQIAAEGMDHEPERAAEIIEEALTRVTEAARTF